MTYIVCLLFVGSIILMCVYQLQQISTNEQSGNSNKLLTALSINDLKIHSRKIDDCNLERQYCFTDPDCFNRCQFSDKGVFQCVTGVCKLVFHKDRLDSSINCELKQGMAPFLIGVPELATVEAICKPVDQGIVYHPYANETEIKNKMCEGGVSSIDYLTSWPDPENCDCGDGKLPIIIPATENVRQYVQCIKNDDVLKWVYDETKLTYHKEKIRGNDIDDDNDIYNT